MAKAVRELKAAVDLAKNIIPEVQPPVYVPRNSKGKRKRKKKKEKGGYYGGEFGRIKAPIIKKPPFRNY